ncbi:MAG: hypothetical protein AAGF92_01730 [Myxococcota bacterium]
MKTRLLFTFLALAAACGDTPTAAPADTQGTQAASIRRACEEWCIPIFSCSDQPDAELCMQTCMERERFTPPICTRARLKFLECRLEKVQCFFEEICNAETGVCTEELIECTCDDAFLECGNSVDDNPDVNACAAENQANCELQCEGEAQLAACQLTGRCFTDELLTACGNCVNNFELYFECLLENQGCPLDEAAP